MEIKDVVDALKKARQDSKKRNFEQSVEFSVVLREFDLKKPENKIDEFMLLPTRTGKPVKICALVDKELTTQAREVFDKVIFKDDFPGWVGRKTDVRKLARDYDYFVAQSTIMIDIAKVFGKALGSKGKMPNPKSGAIVPSKVDLKLIKEKLIRTVRVMTNKQTKVDVLVGKESMSDEDIAKNAIAIFQKVISRLPRGVDQIKKSYIKLTMGKPQAVGA